MRWSVEFLIRIRMEAESLFDLLLVERLGRNGAAGRVPREREVNRIIPVRIDMWKFNNIPYIRIIHRRTATRIVYKYKWQWQSISFGRNLTWFIVRLLFAHVHANVNVYIDDEQYVDFTDSLLLYQLSY